MKQSSILKKTMHIGLLTWLSRCIAFVREFLLVRFLGIGIVSDAFFAAFNLPNMMRKLFAEGALSSILVPLLVKIKNKEPEEQGGRFVVAVQIIVQLFLGLVCSAAYVWAFPLLKVVAPGFSFEQLTLAVQYFRILVSFIMFLSSAAIFTAALQAIGHFTIPAFAPAFMNVFYVAALGVCVYFGLSVALFCKLMLIAAAANVVMHIVAFYRYGYRFMLPDTTSWSYVYLFVLQFLPCIVSVSIKEINFFVDKRFASYLMPGSLSLLRYAFRFVDIPLGVFGASFITVLLAYFSKLKAKGSDKLQEHYVESLKFLWWLCIPVIVVMGFFAKDIFYVLFSSQDFNEVLVAEARLDLIAYLAGLYFLAINRLFLNIFYVYEKTSIPMFIALGTAFLNYWMDKWLISLYGGPGLALATTVSNIVSSLLFIWTLARYCNLHIYWRDLGCFIWKYAVQLVALGSVFALFYFAGIAFLNIVTFSFWIRALHITPQFFMSGFGLWLWVGPGSLAYMAVLYLTRSWFGITITYFDKSKQETIDSKKV